VSLAAARERLRPVRALAGGEIPRSPGEIDAGWLTAALGSRVPGVRVSSVKLISSSVGTTTRGVLEVAFEDARHAAGLPARLFVKCTATVAQRLMLGLGGFIEGEVEFYSNVRPMLEIEAPVGYFAALDPRSWRSVVVMEDVVSRRGARFWQPSTTIGRREAEELLAQVARWHGALWDQPQLAAWPWLKTPADRMRVIESLIGVADRTSAGARRARTVIPRALRGRENALYEGLRRWMQIASRGPRTYLHGDLHVANTYRTGAGRVGIVDWQGSLQGCWAHDFAHILATALEIEERRAWERDLLDLYLARLVAAGGGALHPRVAWLAYRHALFYPYFAWTYTIGRSRLQPAFQPADVSLKLLERIAAAICDLDSLGAVGL
jgi:hypothetical protein